MPRGIPRENSTKKKLLHRLKIARGHMDKVITMVETDDYCIDVIHQIVAVQAALGQTNKSLLNNHLECCVSDAFKKGNNKDAIDEVMKVMDKMTKQRI